MKMLKSLVLVTITVAGCSSFNKIEIHGPVILDSGQRAALSNEEPVAASQPQADPVEAVIAEKPVTPPPVLANLAGLCPAYKAPALPKTPELPLADIKRLAGTNDKNAIDKLMLDHIEALRLHAALVKRTVLQSQLRYAEQCKRWQRDHQQ